MRFFLCPFDGFTTAIPTDSVSSLMHCSVFFSKNTEEDESAFIVSLIQLLKLKAQDTRHAIILKNSRVEYGGTTKSKTVLLTTEVECEVEIQGDEIYPLPHLFKGMLFSSFFSGILFSPRQQIKKKILGNPILILNPETLILSLVNKRT